MTARTMTASARGASRAGIRGVARIALALACAMTLMSGMFARVDAQMPDLSQMSGRPLPSGDLPMGTVSVRIIRGALNNNIAGVDVRLVGAGQAALSAKTDANGRATFSNVAAGRTWRATATVDGERLESQTFTMPTAGGLRMLLVAALGSGGATASASGGAGAGAAQAVPGEVTLGGQSRVVIELAEESLEVYGLFELANPGGAPVMPAQPIVFEIPAGATNATVLEGSTAQAKAEKTRVIVTGPFASGSTPVQIAYRFPYDGDTVRLSQVLPLRLAQTTVIVRKLEGLQLTLANAQGQRDVPLEGRTYVVVNGGALDAGTPLACTLRGLPHRPAWPRYAALGLALAIILGGVTMAIRVKPDALDEGEMRALRTRRASLFEQLVSLERRRTDKVKGDPGLIARRDELMAEIEALDDRIAAAEPPPPPPASASAQSASDAETAAAEPSSERLGARPLAR